ncbi:MAG TPA: S-adenosylmethionine:tRNA ribosyltransferase-isomerase [Dinghuibacter sp.]|uniref:S-adenosylmethionine:tRNA ribosyltransferase-isomerase n=1 Tax=Dinghuibacter sp. TaxID=2024697 RepID=UPI002BABDBFF|nr:S-adenosylmethionine:tRNA ribosyltransferase-isomerase [Dinghuibacter sp.]HTJ11575.1 S-adenosylmethionine:tRNA ribosyltransferase-isomerase [Dinghuibacter sp.]
MDEKAGPDGAHSSAKGPRDLRIGDYTYDLPEDRVAQYPLGERDASKLLVYEGGAITEARYRDLPGIIPGDALMVFNDTKVIEARLLFRKETGGQIEIFCLEPLDAEPSRAMMQQGSATWKCLVGGAAKWKTGPLVRTWENGLRLEVEKLGTVPDGYRVRFRWTPGDLHFAGMLHRAGLVPLPPYLNRSMEELDAERYQTVYARFDGSVAAPTAGLHFTQDLLGRLGKKGVTTDFVTLHVGAGTFKPVKAERMEEHVMHAEWIDVTRAFVERLRAHEGPVVGVGTTALRTLESLYWMGVKGTDEPLTQWEIYDTLPQDMARRDALDALLGRMGERLIAQTQLLIAPGYRPRIAHGLVTNFHQPGSTLLLLVAALLGDDWRKVYRYALDNDFRFLSYGDGSLLWF